jgi:hypothetical protein
MHLPITEYFKLASPLGALASTAAGALAGHFLGAAGAEDKSQRLQDWVGGAGPAAAGHEPPPFENRFTDPATDLAGRIGTGAQTHLHGLDSRIDHLNPHALGGAALGGAAGLGAHLMASRRPAEPKTAAPILPKHFVRI